MDLSNEVKVKFLSHARAWALLTVTNLRKPTLTLDEDTYSYIQVHEQVPKEMLRVQFLDHFICDGLGLCSFKIMLRKTHIHI